MKDYEPLDLSKVKTYSLGDRPSKVSMDFLGKVYEPGASFTSFLESLPDILAGRTLLEIIQALSEAFRNKRAVILGMGAHVIKCGMNPLIIDLISKGMISGIAMNGAGAIHDVELAYAGKTSEDVAEHISDGRFGMVKETSAIINHAVNNGAKQNLGYGQAVGKTIVDQGFQNAESSIFAAAYRYQVPVTVHVAIGTDINHMHAEADGAAIGQCSHTDFRIFCSLVKGLEGGGVYMNAGSAVILPEVFLKAVSVVRNLGFPLKQFTTVNLDFIQHYRPRENVVHRPVMDGGKGYFLTGHHEILIPLIIAGYKETVRKFEDPSVSTT